MRQKIRVGILFGGKSEEHEVSIQSAKNVVEALDRKKYDPILIGITKKGQWMELPEQQFHQLASRGYQALPEKVLSKPEPPTMVRAGVPLISSGESLLLDPLDVVFPVLHGPFGEDGSIQGFLQTCNIPFVGASILGSAIGMDKDITKRLLRDAGVAVTRFIAFRRNDTISFTKLKKQLGLPVFIKPASLGSSIGVTKVSSEKEFGEAVKKAFTFDNKILVEEAIAGREVECSVLGNEDMIASTVGEIISQHEFYDYSAKYLDEHGATLCIPASLPGKTVRTIQELAIKTCKVLSIEGMARVDFFIKEDNTLYVNEVNTIPGFTNISMYPMLWKESGISYPELLDKLIQLSLERFQTDDKGTGNRK